MAIGIFFVSGCITPGQWARTTPSTPTPGSDKPPATTPTLPPAWQKPSADTIYQWRGWREVPGSGTTDVSLAATAFNNELFLFSKGIDDDLIYVNTYDPSDNWSGWVVMPGTTNVALGPVVFNGKLYLFSRGIKDERIYFNIYYTADKWSGWTQVPGGMLTDVPIGATVFNDKLFIFSNNWQGIGDRRIYVNTCDNADTWSGWKEVPRIHTTNAAVAPVVFNGKLYLFAKGIDDRLIYVNTCDSAGSWSGWEQVSGGGTTDAALTAAVYNDKIYLFSKNIIDERIYVNTFDTEGNWSGAQEMPGHGTTAFPLTAVTFNDSLYLFANGIVDDKHIYVNTFSPVDK